MGCHQLIFQSVYTTSEERALMLRVIQDTLVDVEETAMTEMF